MICSSCRRQLFNSVSSASKTNGLLSSTTSTITTAPRRGSRLLHATSVSLSSAPVAPTSRSSSAITQPLTSSSTPTQPGGQNTSSTPSPDSTSPNPLPESQESRKLPISSIPGGEVLKGLAYLKNKPQILAKEDVDYPEWLWDLADEGKADAKSKLDDKGLEKIDLNAMTKKARQKAMKKRQALLATMPTIIPPHEQATDLTQKGDTAFQHVQKREEVVKSARDGRRKAIRERNYLGGM